MEKDIIENVKKCPTCQLAKRNRIRPKEEAVISDAPTEPNEKIAMDIYGPLRESSDGCKYILSIRGTLNKYLV